MTIALSSHAGRRNGGRWLLYGLLASLLVNAFLIGLAATDVFWPRHVGGPLRFELRWLERKLPADGFARVAAAVEGIEPKVQAHIDRLKEMRQQVSELAAIPQPDRAAVDRKLADIRAELDAMTAEGQATVADALLALPPNMRASLAETQGGR
jgi:uncharacterized membrane protein